MTEEQENFIIENRTKYCINDLSKITNVSYHIIRKYLVNNNLMISKSLQMKIRDSKRNLKKNNNPPDEDGYITPTYIFDFWNNDLNPITMLSINK